MIRSLLDPMSLKPIVNTLAKLRSQEELQVKDMILEIQNA